MLAFMVLWWEMMMFYGNLIQKSGTNPQIVFICLNTNKWRTGFADRDWILAYTIYLNS